MKLTDFQGYEIHLPESGGKAGRGQNVMSSIQARKNNQVLKQFRFTANSPESRRLAMRKLKNWILGENQK